MLRNDQDAYGPERCAPECGCDDTCAANGYAIGHNDQVLPGYTPDAFRRNVEVLNRTLENISFALGVHARLLEEAYLIGDEA